MKKLIPFALAASLLFTTAGCAKNEQPTTTNATEVLSQAWTNYSGEEFMAIGGDIQAPVENEPGTIDLSNKETATMQLIVSNDMIDQIETASTLVHAMNQNSFTAMSLTLKEGQKADAFIQAWEEELIHYRWMCGFPEKYVFLTMDSNNIIGIYGISDLVDAFTKDITKINSQTKITVEGMF